MDRIKTTTLNGAEIVIRCLQEEGVEHVFGYPGGAVLFIYDAIFKQKAVKHVLVRHEQGALHAAGLLKLRTTCPIGDGTIYLTDLTYVLITKVNVG